MKRFTFLAGDVNWRDYGGTWYRRAAPGQYHIIELVNMDDACGWDNKGHPTYYVELSLVDLNEIPVKTMRSALDSCGTTTEVGNLNAWDTWNESDRLGLVDALHGYGAKALLWQASGNAYRPLLAQARAESRALDNDDTLETRMERPINRLGSTAREFMRGDFQSALLRGVMRGDRDARLMAKIHSGGTITDTELDACIDPATTEKEN